MVASSNWWKESKGGEESAATHLLNCMAMVGSISTQTVSGESLLKCNTHVYSILFLSKLNSPFTQLR